MNTLDPKGIPVVTPAGVLGGHLDAMKFCEHIPQEEYPAGALAAALYLCSGVRGMERGTVSSVRDENGKEILADVELVRLACPRRVFTLSQIKYVCASPTSRPCSVSSWAVWNRPPTGRHA